ncbi:MAG: hypothetical protein AAF909_08245 [Pseudomonadota bacterium]
MSFKLRASALAQALIEDLQQFTPFGMAAMSEYGKVGGYAPGYQEVRADALDFLDLCHAASFRAGAEETARLPEITPGRAFNEAFFARERETIASGLHAAQTELSATSDDGVHRAFIGLEDEYQRHFEFLLHRSGLDAPDLAASDADRAVLAESGGPFAGAGLSPGSEAGGPARVYVSSRYSAQLTDQIAEVVAQFGLDPVITPASGSLDLAKVERDLRECVGGVFGLLTPEQGADGAAPAASPPRPGATLGAAFGERALSPGLAEVALAERHMGRHLMILAQREIVPRLPTRLRSRPIFTLRRRSMDPTEFSEFKSVAAQTGWLR